MGLQGQLEVIQSLSPHPLFLLPSSACVLTVIHASLRGQGESLLGVKEAEELGNLGLPHEHQPAQCQLLNVQLGCPSPQQ